MNNKRISEASRTEAFSDAFFAIAITILILEFEVPHFEKGKLSETLLDFWSSLIAFLFSFTYIGIIWLNHHSLFNHIKFVNRQVHWINFGILATTILLAFPTGVLAEAFRNGNQEDKGTAVALYSTCACLMSLSWVPVFRYFKNHPELLEETSSWLYFKNQWIRPWIGVVFYAVAAIVGKYIPLAGMLIFLFMVAYHAYTSEGIGGIDQSKKKSNKKATY